MGETDQSDLVLDPEPGGRSQLLTDKDPLLGGLQGLCDTAGKIKTHMHTNVYYLQFKPWEDLH